MYLVATAMHLAPCALGGGNSAAFAQAAGTNEFDESSVGEFLLGSPRADLMSQACVDEVFGRALTNRGFRARLLADAREPLDGYDLTDDERRHVLGWTDDTFDDVTSDLESRIDRARFDGIGFQTTADHDESPQPLANIDPAVLNRLVASVLPELAQPPPRSARSHDRDPERHRNTWLDEVAALGAALHQRMSPASPMTGCMAGAGAASDDPLDAVRTDLVAREGCLRDAGIIRQMGESSVQCGETRLVACSVLYGGPYADARYVLPQVCGARGLTRMRLVSWHSLKRPSAFPRQSTTSVGSVLDCYAHLAADAVSPAAFALFSPLDTPRRAFLMRRLPTARASTGRGVTLCWRGVVCWCQPRSSIAR